MMVTRAAISLWALGSGGLNVEFRAPVAALGHPKGKRSKCRGPSCSDFGGLNGMIVRAANTRRHNGRDSALHHAKDGVSQRLAMCKSPNLIPRVNLNYVIETY